VRFLAQAGRQVFGPWYVLSDQFLEGDEARARNLLKVCANAVTYDRAMPEGYVPDSCGAIAT
jgi:alpha-mannosidase